MEGEERREEKEETVGVVNGGQERKVNMIR